MRFSVRARTQNALFRRVRFSSPAQTWSHLTQRRILRRRPHAKAQSAPATSGKGALRATARMQSAPFGEAHTQNALFRHVATPGRCGATPARLRGTMENASTGQMRSSNPPPGCGAGCARVRRSRFGVWPHGKAHSAQPVGFRMRFSVRDRTQNALFRGVAGTDCAFS